MKKKLTLLLVALVAVAAFAVQVSRRAVAELTVISEATVWDFSKDVTLADTHEGDLQYKDDAKNVENIYANIADLQFAESFKADALAFTGEYPFRSNSKKMAQNGTLHFKTSVPGKIVVKFSDTGSKASATAVKRYLVVNGETTEYWASRPNNSTEEGKAYDAQLNVTTDEIAVPAGDVTISGTSALVYTYVSFTPAPTTYTVAGSSTDVFGTAWDPANTANDMVKNGETGLYEWTASEVTLPAGDVEFKVVKNHTWTESEAYPAENYKLNIAESGKYNVTITFNADTKDVAATATKVGDAVVTVDYYLVGSFNSWEKTEEYKLAKNEKADGEYMITVDLAADAAFKVLSSSGTWYPGGGPDLTVAEAGNYTIYFRPDGQGGEGWADGYIYVQKNNAETVGENDIVIKAEDIKEGDITAALAAAKEGKEKIGNITINLKEGASYTVGASLEPGAGKFTINGNGATITATNILVSLPATPVVAANEEKVNFYELGAITIDNVKLSTSKAIVKSNAKYLVSKIDVTNSVIELTAAISPFDFGSGQFGYPAELNMKNSTLWASVTNNKPYFTSQSGNSPKDINDNVAGAAEKQAITFENCTLYNICFGANFNNLRQKGQNFLIFTVKNNVIVNCGKDNFLNGMDGGQNSTSPTWTVDGNIFGKIKDGVYTDLGASQTNNGEVTNTVAGTLAFTDAAAGDFNGTVTLNAGSAPAALGDSRWTINYELAPAVALANPEKLYIMGSCVKGWDAEDRLQEMAFDETAQAFTYNLKDEKNTIFFTIGDVASFTDWQDFNNWHRYAYERQESHEQKGIIGTATQLYTTRGEGTINLPAGDWTISISKADGMMTITGEATPVPVDTWTVAGSSDVLFGTAWDPANTANDMVKNGETGLYEWTAAEVALPAGDVEFKVVKNHTWDESEAYPAENYKLNIAESGKYNVTITFNADTKDVAATATKVGDAVVTVDYYLVGSFNSWTQKDENYKLAKNEEVDGEYMITVDLAAGTEFKVLSSSGTWYPGGLNLTVVEAGNYTIYFRPDGMGGEGWADGVIYIQKNVVDAINGIRTAAENGQLFNLRGQRIAAPVKGQIYIVNGRKVVVK